MEQDGFLVEKEKKRKYSIIKRLYESPNGLVSKRELVKELGVTLKTLRVVVDEIVESTKLQELGVQVTWERQSSLIQAVFSTEFSMKRLKHYFYQESLLINLFFACFEELVPSITEYADNQYLSYSAVYRRIHLINEQFSPHFQIQRSSPVKIIGNEEVLRQYIAILMLETDNEYQEQLDELKESLEDLYPLLEGIELPPKNSYIYTVMIASKIRWEQANFIKVKNQDRVEVPESILMWVSNHLPPDVKPKQIYMEAKFIWYQLIVGLEETVHQILPKTEEVRLSEFDEPYEKVLKDIHSILGVTLNEENQDRIHLKIKKCMILRKCNSTVVLNYFIGIKKQSMNYYKCLKLLNQSHYQNDYLSNEAIAWCLQEIIEFDKIKLHVAIHGFNSHSFKRQFLTLELLDHIEVVDYLDEQVGLVVTDRELHKFSNKHKKYVITNNTMYQRRGDFLNWITENV